MHFFAARSKTPITRVFQGGNTREFYWSDLNVQKEYSPPIGAIDYACGTGKSGDCAAGYVAG